MQHYREMGTFFDSGNWVNLMKKVVDTAIYTAILLIIVIYLKLMCIN